MTFKKHNWVTYGRNGEIVIIIIQDGTGRKIESFTCGNNKDLSKAIGTLKEKYGFSFEKDLEKDKKEFNDEIDWLKKDSKW